MSEQPLRVSLKATNHRLGQFILTFNSSQYSVTLSPETNVTFSEWLRRLYPVLAGQKDPSNQLTPQELLRNVGTWLWQALLPEGAPAQERDTLEQALRKGRTPLLLALPDTLAGLPWELLYDPQLSGDKGFLARRRPLMRLSASTTTMTPIEPPLRVLLLISSPPGLGENSRVDVESERAAVEQATRQAREEGKLYLCIEDIVTPQRVEAVLERFQPQIVHYIGHGEYKEQRSGVLLWEDEQGKELLMTAERLAKILRPWHVWAVVLHACQTGMRTARVDEFSFADTLAHQGLPVILAQQANFSYESSLLASTAWYTALTTGQSFAEALLKIRQRLSEAGRPDWAVPILQGDVTSLTSMLAATSVPGSTDPLLIRREAAADLSPLTDSFVGRHRELRALCLMLESTPGNGPVLALITGPGGMGKSTLVTQAITRYGGTYKAALMLSCGGYSGIDLFLQRVGELLKRLEAPGFLEHILPDPKLSITTKIEEAITALNEVGPVLLVFDNLESVQNDDHTINDTNLLSLLQNLFTNLHGGRILLTGRYMVKDLLASEDSAALILHLNLEDLSPYETNQLLLRHPALAQLSEIVRQKLVQEFGGLPYVYDLLSSKAANEDLEQIIYEIRDYGTKKQKMITEERKQYAAEEWQKVHHEAVEFTTLQVIINHLSKASQTLLAQLGVLYQPFPHAAIEEGLGATLPEWQALLDWSLLHYDSYEKTYRLHSITRRYAENLLNEADRTQAQAQLAVWYEQYADHESHELTDYLEARRLWRAAGLVQQAGALVIQLAEALRRFGQYSLLCELCMITLNDIHEHDQQLIAQAQYYLGIIAQDQGDYQKARQRYNQSLDISERLGDQRGRASTLHQLGTIAQDQGDYQEARRLYGQSLDISEQQGDQWGQNATLHHLGMIAQGQGDYQEARRLYVQCLDTSERLSDYDGRASTLHQLGMIAQDQGDYQEARQRYNQSLNIKERLGDQRGRASTLHQLGTIAQDQGDYQEARRLYGQSLDISERLGDQWSQANSLHNLGNVAYLLGDYQEARRLYCLSLDISKRLGDQHGQATSLRQLGTIAQDQGDYQKALQFYDQSLDISERLGDQRGQVSTLHQLGTIAGFQKDYMKARRLYAQSMDIFEQLGDQRGQASTLQNLGVLAYEQQDYKHALAYTIQAYTLLDILHLPSHNLALRIRALVRYHLDEATFLTYWRTIAGNRPLPSLTDEETNQLLQQAIIDFLQIPMWNESKRFFLEAHPELLQPEADTLLQVLVAQYEDDRTRKIIEVNRRLLAHCRDEGIKDAFVGMQNLAMIFSAELNRIYNEVITAKRSGTKKQREILVTRLEQMLQGDLPIVGALDFLRVLVAWLRGQDTILLEETLQPPFRDLYAQMVAAVEQEATEPSQKEKALTLDDLPNAVASVIMQGIPEQRQQFATVLREQQQHLSSGQDALGNFLGCLIAALQGETPGTASLETPFTTLWQAFQDALHIAPDENIQKEKI